MAGNRKGQGQTQGQGTDKVKGTGKGKRKYRRTNNSKIMNRKVSRKS